MKAQKIHAHDFKSCVFLFACANSSTVPTLHGRSTGVRNNYSNYILGINTQIESLVTDLSTILLDSFDLQSRFTSSPSSSAFISLGGIQIYVSFVYTTIPCIRNMNYAAGVTARFVLPTVFDELIFSFTAGMTFLSQSHRCVSKFV